MELGLNDFLSQLGNETVNRINREHKVKEIQPTSHHVKQEQQIDMPKTETKKVQTQTEELNEEFIETALDYASVVIKTIRESFETKQERVKIMESIRAAIDIYLNEYNIPQTTTSPLFNNQNKITEQEFNAMPTVQTQQPGYIKMNDLSGTPVNVANNQNPIMENKLNIGVVVGSDGKKHADLSKLDQNDIKSLRILSGIEDLPQ